MCTSYSLEGGGQLLWEETRHRGQMCVKPSKQVAQQLQLWVGESGLLAVSEAKVLTSQQSCCLISQPPCLFLTVLANALWGLTCRN